MDHESPDTGLPIPFESPDAILDALRDHPDWDDGRRASAIDLLVGRFSQEDLAEAILPRLDDLSGDDAEAIIRLVEYICSMRWPTLSPPSRICRPNERGRRSTPWKEAGESKRGRI